jgi:hypothetical protein
MNPGSLHRFCCWMVYLGSTQDCLESAMMGRVWERQRQSTAHQVVREDQDTQLDRREKGIRLCLVIMYSTSKDATSFLSDLFCKPYCLAIVRFSIVPYISPASYWPKACCEKAGIESQHVEISLGRKGAADPTSMSSQLSVAMRCSNIEQ